MQSHFSRPARLALLALASVSMLPGCGSGETDSGGLTVRDWNAAQTALNSLQTSNIPIQILSLTSTAGAVPAACRVHLLSRKPHTFKVYVFWIPYVGPQSYSWLDMTITKDISRDKFHLGTAPSIDAGGAGLGGKSPAAFPEFDHPLKYTLGQNYTRITQHELKAHAGNAFSKPGAACQVLKNGYLRLLSNP